jgi:hypothetical protein
MGKTNPTQKEITPIYVGWLDKATKLYRQKKDKRESSARTSTSTISDFLLSVGEQPTPTTKDYPPPTDVKRVPPPTPMVGNTNIPTEITADPINAAFWNLNTPK